ncbi:hypothetical protein [Paraconexibacter algicola]|nr:hypothetical protein [Paraconexibacter algicola]
MSEPLSLRVGYPVPTEQHAAVLLSIETVLELAGPLAEVRVPGEPGAVFLEDWQVTRAALMARMASTLRHISYLVPSMSRLDGAALCRTLVDHVIHYAWISADPPARLPRFLRKTYNSALSKHARWAERGETLLTPELHAHYTAFIATHPEGPGKLRPMAATVDTNWLNDVRAAAPAPLQMVSMSELYEWVYDPFADLDHPSAAALQSFVHLDPNGPAAWVDGEPERDAVTDMRPFWLAVWAIIWALTVAELTQGRPGRSALQAAIQRVRALREYDRHGLLDVRTTADGMVIGLVADADEQIAAITRANG